MSRIETEEQDTSENQHVLKIFTARSAALFVLMGNVWYLNEIYWWTGTHKLLSWVVIIDESMSFFYFTRFSFLLLSRVAGVQVAQL